MWLSFKYQKKKKELLIFYLLQTSLNLERKCLKQIDFFLFFKQIQVLFIALSEESEDFQSQRYQIIQIQFQNAVNIQIGHQRLAADIVTKWWSSSG